VTAPQILISAGEASGDMYAARLATAIRERTGAQIFGMGGPKMAAAGVDLIANYHEVAVVGISEVLHKIPAVVGVQRRLAREAVRRKASLAILVDSPGTHLGTGRRMKNAGIPIGYFIGPQVWAWRPGRVRIIKRLVKRIVVIFPFEEKIYRDAGVPVDFVGHPLVDVVRPTAGRSEFVAKHGLDPARPIVALLPGSRLNEIARHYATVVAGCERLIRASNSRSSVQFALAAAPGLGREVFERLAQPTFPIHRIEGATYDVLASADCAIVASGTATVEAALLGTPMIVIYRVAPVSALILRHMLETRDIGMVNVIAGRRIVPELVQDGLTPAAIETEVRRLLESQSAREEMKEGLAEVRARLGPGGAIERAADIFVGML
jgi:lipid-A-disaccharide synthase